jgi:hypothetical protein
LYGGNGPWQAMQVSKVFQGVSKVFLRCGGTRMEDAGWGVFLSAQRWWLLMRWGVCLGQVLLLVWQKSCVGVFGVMLGEGKAEKEF